MKLTSLYISFILTIIFSFNYTALSAQADSIKGGEGLPLDKSIRYGRLLNGLTYFIKPIETKQSKIQLRLYNKVGSNQEDEDQRGIAHAIEHLAFKSSKLFPSGIRNSNIREELGMRMYDFTGSSGPRNTEYYFDIPRNNQQTLETGLLWFKDILTGLELLEKDISIVKGELRQEFLGKSGVDLGDKSLQSQLYSEIFSCTENDIGYIETIESLEPKAFKRFYNDWYRPDLMGISIVGNLDKIDETERLIKKVFSGIKSPARKRPLFNCDAAYFGSPPHFISIERPEDTTALHASNSVKFYLFYRDSISREGFSTLEGNQEMIKFNLLEGVLKERLNEATNKYLSSEFLVRDTYAYSKLPHTLEVVITDKNGAEKKALEKVVHIIYQIKEIGPLEEEWDRHKLKQLENLNADYENSPRYWNNEIKNYYSYGEALPSSKTEKLVQWLENLTLEEFNVYLNEFFTRIPEDIGIIAPAGHKALSYTEKEVRSWIQDVYHEPITAYRVPEVFGSLLSDEEINRLEEKSFRDLGKGSSGAREIILENGVKVVLKSISPTGVQKKRIFLHGLALKGAGNFPEEDYASVINATSIVMNSGVNGMDKFSLNRLLSGSSMVLGNVRPYIDIRETGIQANSDSKDLETLLQLVYLYFTKPNKNKKAFEDWKISKVKAYQSLTSDILGKDNSNAIRKLTGDKSLQSFFGMRVSAGTNSYQSIGVTDFETAYSVYEELFGNAKEFTFIISGEFEIAKLLPLIQKYLGNLPVMAKSAETISQTELTNPLKPGPSFVSFPAPGDYEIKNIPYSFLFIEKVADLCDWQEQLKIAFLGLIATHKAWPLRFKKGYSIYDVNINGIYNADMNRFEIGGTFYCVPEEFSKIRKEISHIISEIKDGEISQDAYREASSVMNYLYSAERANRPNEIRDKLYMHYRFGLPWIESEEVEQYVKLLTIEDVVETSNKYFSKNNLYEFVMTD